ncbi:hypothetical protein [Brevundimonas bacteroides]|uniref:hypothetical protein n=1 Tax=Brevundimonas bacteroides TaxID=74311 RepID=UPI0004975232|nr:hypothetical protein [Brevundimonas bacteroides]
MIDGNAVPPPPPETEGKTQRVSIEGTLASLSAISALIVAAASMFTAVQALDVSRTAARQKIFESQLAVCMQFSELTAQAADEGAKTSGLIEGQLDDAAWEELNTRWEAGAVLSTAIYRQYLQMTMIFPDEVSDLAYVATEKRTEIANRQVDAMEAEALTPEIRADLERLSNEEADALNAAAAACRDHVSATAGI